MENKREIKLIVTDMDGTLFTTDKQITPRARRAIKEARARGVRFTVATGRPRASLINILEELEISEPVIIGNGAFIQDGEKYYHKEVMKDEDIRDVMQVAEDVGVAFYAFDENLIYGVDNEVTRKTTAIWLERAVSPTLKDCFRFFGTYDEVLAAVSGRTAKLLIFEMDLELNAKARKALDERCKVMAVNAEPHAIDISNVGVSKGNAIAELGKILDIPVENIMALGDGENDKEMMSVAGLGVAMANAVPATLAAADYVTLDNDSDGWAYAVEKFVLGEH
ncbi:MAG: HAD family phosphatase [Christensenellaceae bacterium]|nr:HAD family phosphatase [Christensenellaceae bacterium]